MALYHRLDKEERTQTTEEVLIHQGCTEDQSVPGKVESSDLEIESYSGHWKVDDSGRSPVVPLRSSPVLGSGLLQSVVLLAQHTDMCKELSHPLPDIIEKTLDGLLDAYKEDSLAHR